MRSRHHIAPEPQAKVEAKQDAPTDNMRVHIVTPAAGRSLLIERAFLDPQTCHDIRHAMDRGVDDAAEVAGTDIARRERVRRARSIEIDPSLLATIEARLEDARAAIERTIRQTIGEREGTGFLRYNPGGFYRQHRDRGQVAGWPAAARRLITVVVFLNAAGPEPGFDGGELCLYGSDSDPVVIRPETGLLAAFPADLLHEVKPVTRGVRDTAVDWFYESPRT